MRRKIMPPSSIMKYFFVAPSPLMTVSTVHLFFLTCLRFFLNRPATISSFILPHTTKLQEVHCTFVPVVFLSSILVSQAALTTFFFTCRKAAQINFPQKVFHCDSTSRKNLKTFSPKLLCERTYPPLLCKMQCSASDYNFFARELLNLAFFQLLFLFERF